MRILNSRTTVTTEMPIKCRKAVPRHGNNIEWPPSALAISRCRLRPAVLVRCVASWREAPDLAGQPLRRCREHHNCFRTESTPPNRAALHVAVSRLTASRHGDERKLPQTRTSSFRLQRKNDGSPRILPLRTPRTKSRGPAPAVRLFRTIEVMACFTTERPVSAASSGKFPVPP